jgi:hypothetical protein
MACGDSEGSDGGAQANTATTTPSAAPLTTARLEGPFALPFGLEQLEGTEPLGRPAVYDEVIVQYNGVDIWARTLRAAYRVTADDPPAVVRAWLAQLDDLTLDVGTLSVGDGSLWLEASAGQPLDAPPGDSATLQLWATDDAPILLVHVNRVSDDPPRSPTIDDDVGTPPAPSTVIESTERVAGDVLFDEQGDNIHLPPGTWALTPRLFPGIGSSLSLVATEDGEAAVRALLDEATEANGHGEATGPTVTTTDGTEVAIARFIIPAGGWGFDVVAVQAPDDPFATLYVASYDG